MHWYWIFDMFNYAVFATFILYSLPSTFFIRANFFKSNGLYPSHWVSTTSEGVFGFSFWPMIEDYIIFCLFMSNWKSSYTLCYAEIKELFLTLHLVEWKIHITTNSVQLSNTNYFVTIVDFQNSIFQMLPNPNEFTISLHFRCLL